MSSTVWENWMRVKNNIDHACQRSQRDPSEIHVVAVTKYVDLDRMKETLAAGLEHIGENKAQDVVQKWDQLNGDKGIWHFIGHLQSNKVKYIMNTCTYIHSLDRLSLAQEIEKQAARSGQMISCFVQVNIAEEDSKHGLAKDEVATFIDQLSDFPHIQTIGLMTMAPHYEDPELARPIFQRLKEMQLYFQQQKWSHAPLSECSMGMSNDYQVAIEEGASYIRLGSCLVGRQ